MFIAEIKATDISVSLEQFRLKALAWANQHHHVAYFNPNEIPYPHSGFEHLLAVSSGEALHCNEADAFDKLRQELQQEHPLFCGFLTYDLKNQIEKLQSNNSDRLNFPLLHFFSPSIYLYFKKDCITVYSIADNIDTITAAILATETPLPANSKEVLVQQRIPKAKYIADVERVRQLILEGEVYELNYCMEFFAERVVLQPLPLYLALNEASPTPFSGYLKCHDKYLLCASPERFLKKENQKLISQPIKGTVRRGITPQEDAALQYQLRHNEKELAENMMIVDLVRNDLSHSCATGTVQVEEMFGIYGFRQVSQMISTIVGELRPDKDLVDALKGAFPMGSMTGAPKISAMKYIEELEVTRRGLYSGAFGFIKPNNDCDFNVVIRSIQYNAGQQYLSFMVGSAITFDSDPELEYTECLLKAQAMFQVLGHK